MAVRISTGYADLILGNSSFAGIFLNGAIEIYSGAQPASADDAATGTLLGRITRDGGAWSPGSPSNGLQFTKEGRYVSKNAAHSWTLVGVATGTAGWCRLRGNATDVGASSTMPRIDGAVGLIDTAGDYQLLLPTLSITTSSSIAITSWWYALPPLT